MAKINSIVPVRPLHIASLFSPKNCEQQEYPAQQQSLNDKTESWGYNNRSITDTCRTVEYHAGNIKLLLRPIYIQVVNGYDCSRSSNPYNWSLFRAV